MSCAADGDKPVRWARAATRERLFVGRAIQLWTYCARAAGEKADGGATKRPAYRTPRPGEPVGPATTIAIRFTVDQTGQPWFI